MLKFTNVTKKQGPESWFDKTVPESCYTHKAGMVAKTVPQKLGLTKSMTSPGKLAQKAGSTRKLAQYPPQNLGGKGSRKLGYGRTQKATFSGAKRWV